MLSLHRIFFKICAIALVALLSACATVPQNSTHFEKNSLSLCQNIKVSNAPAHDRSGKITRYSPFITINNVSLARAPVDGCLSSAFGPRRGGAGKIHKGIDLYTRTPTPIAAAAKGKISFIGSQKGYGKTVIIDHGNGVTTRYAHLSSYDRVMRVGLRVLLGDVIGRTGKTGNATATHLHYEVRLHGKTINPLSAD